MTVEKLYKMITYIRVFQVNSKLQGLMIFPIDNSCFLVIVLSPAVLVLAP